MSSKRTLRKNACAGKKRYVSGSEAQAALYLMMRSGKDTRLMTAYRCDFHGENRPRHFHIGHKVRADRAVIP